MGRNETTVLGIDLYESEIRVVEVRYRGNKAVVVNAGCAPMPHGGMIGDRVVDVGAVSIGLRRLVDSMKCSTNRAIVGISGGTTLRNLTVPPVPDSELPMVVAAEVEHQNLVRSKTGAYTYLKLWPPTNDRNSALVIAVVGVEDDVTSKLRETIERAGLTIDALEPSQFGMYRSVASSAPTTGSWLGLMVGSAFSEVALVKDGHLVAYRRLETGSRLLLPKNVVPTFLQASSGESFETRSEVESMSLSGLENLGTELFRVQEYLSREYADVGPIEKMYLTVDDAGLDPLADELAQRLGITVELVKPLDKEPTVKVPAGDESAFAAAYGLAMRNAPQLTGKVARIDLFSKERTQAQQIETRRNFVGSIVLSATALVLGTVAYFLYDRQIAELDNTTKTQQTQAAQVRSEINTTLAERSKRAQQYKSLRKEGTPITSIMDYIVASLGPGVGVTAVSVTDGMKVTISGEAVDEPSMINSVQTLQRSPLLRGLIIDSFAKVTGGTGITFQLSAYTVPMSRIKLAPDEGAQG